MNDWQPSLLLVFICEDHKALNPIDKLIEFGDDDLMLNNIPRYANYVRAVLPGKDVGVMREATGVLGKLIERGSGSSVEFVEIEMRRAFEWIKGRADVLNLRL